MSSLQQCQPGGSSHVVFVGSDEVAVSQASKRSAEFSFYLMLRLLVVYEATDLLYDDETCGSSCRIDGMFPLLILLFLTSTRQRSEPLESLLLHAELPGQQGARRLPLHQPLLPVAAGPAAAQPPLPLRHPHPEVGDALGQSLPHPAHAAAGSRVPL